MDEPFLTWIEPGRCFWVESLPRVVHDDLVGRSSKADRSCYLFCDGLILWRFMNSCVLSIPAKEMEMW